MAARQLGGFLECRDGIGERACLLVRLAEEHVRQDEGRIELQRLLTLLNGFLELPRIDEMPSHVHVQHQAERVALEGTLALGQRLLCAIDGFQEV
jgi:hypothetical protein